MSLIEPGTRFGDYQVVQFIASGGMGETWGGVKLSLTKAVAIKVLRVDLAREVDAQRRFLREARITAALRHGRIVSVIDYGIYKGLFYLVMERIDGVDLRAFLKAFLSTTKHQKFPPLLAAGIAGEVLEALRYAHGRTVGGRTYGVVHRDIKPDNVLVSSAGEVFVTDFGIARYTSDVTAELDVAGTTRYMAPEQAQGNATIQSDIFGVGTLVYFLLTGEPPLTVREVAGEKSVYDRPVPKINRDDVPEPLQEFLDRSLAYDLNVRFPHADAALTTLDKLLPMMNKRHSTLLRKLYLKCVNAPRSHVTGYLPRGDASATEPRLERFEIEDEGRSLPLRTPSVDLRWGGPAPESEPVGVLESELDVDDGADDGKDMPWLRWKQWERGARSEDDEDDPVDEPGPRVSEPSASVDSSSNVSASFSPEPREPTMLLPRHTGDGVPLRRERPKGTLVVPLSVGQAASAAMDPMATERLPFKSIVAPARAATAPMPAAQPSQPTPRPVETPDVVRPFESSAPSGGASWSSDAGMQPLPYSGAYERAGGSAILAASASSVPALRAERRSPWMPALLVASVLLSVNLAFLLYNSRGDARDASGEVARLEPEETDPPADPPAVASDREHAGDQGSSNPEVAALLDRTTHSDAARTAAPERPPQPEPAVIEDEPVEPSAIVPPASTDTGDENTADPGAPATPPSDPAELEDERSPATGVTKPRPAPKPRVQVLFFMKGTTSGEINISGRIVAVQQGTTITLRPGYYSIQWRRRGETQWAKAGKVRIPALDPKTQYFEVRLDVDGHSSYTRAKRGTP